MKKSLSVTLAGFTVSVAASLGGLALLGIYPTGFAFAQTTDVAALDVFGTFLTDEGTAIIQIEDCGIGSPCGRFIWFSTNGLPEGKTIETFTGRDGRQLLGSLMLKGFSKERSDWRGGTVYDSDHVKTYRAHLKRLPDGSLRVRGCIGPFCHTQVWPEVREW